MGSSKLVPLAPEQEDSEEIKPITDDWLGKAGVDLTVSRSTNANRRRSVQFDTHSPQIIPRRSEVSSIGEEESDMYNFSATSKSNQRTRLAKLLVILSLPAIVVFAQCGLMIARAVLRNTLQQKTVQSISFIESTNRVVSCLQEERRVTTLYLTNFSTFGNYTSFWNATDDAVIQLLLADINNSEFTETANKLRLSLITHRASIWTNNASRTEEVLWYTSQISTLISMIPKHAFLTSDDIGLIWKDLVALELLLKIADDLKLEQDLTVSLIAFSTLGPGESKWIAENRSDIQILFKLSLKFLDMSEQKNISKKRKQNLMQHEMDATYLDALLDDKNRSSTHEFIFGNITMEEQMNRTIMMVEFVEDLIDSCFLRISDRIRNEDSTIYGENALAYGLLAAVTVLFPGLGMFYVQSVNTMAEVIAAYSGDMLVKSAELSFEKKRTDHLLFQMLPKTVANALTHNLPVNAESFECVSIYFSDIVDFDVLTSAYEPLEVIDLLNSLYTMFDTEIDNFDVYKVETIGDAYMVASGLPTRNGNQHAGELAGLGLSLMSSASDFSLPKMPGRRLLLRIGIHSGPCVTCVIGLKMPRYCLFGDTVNTASRMESTGAALRIHMSTASKVLLDELGGFSCVSRGPIDVKGKGVMYTWWLTGREGLNFRIDLVPADKIAWK